MFKTGRPLCSEEEAIRRGFGGPECARRRGVLRETIERLSLGHYNYYKRAMNRLEIWRAMTLPPVDAPLRVEVHPGDWGDVTSMLTRKHGECFAVLNMANAHVPGGAYVEGAAAQEENMFRRTDCHWYVGDDEYDRELDRYRPAMTQLLSAAEGRVYLDRRHHRVCVRGREDRARSDLGYAWLAIEDQFPFFEMRAAAQDLRGGRPFDPDEARRRIAAQLDTLSAHGVRHAVLGAFGCGAFGNPADRVAPIYREEIERRAADFSLIAFAIFAPGYGPDNFTPFDEAFRR